MTASLIVPLPLAAKVSISGQQTVGAIILGLAFVAWALYIVVTISRRDPGEPPGAEMALAPNRKPYYDDEELESFRLDRALLFCLCLLMFIAIALPLYWLREPGRQKNAIVGFDQRSVERGAGLFESSKAPVSPQSASSSGIHFGCADCHGANGQGGSATFVLSDPAHPNTPPHQVSWSAPPLNTVMYRFTQDPPGTTNGVNDVRQILVYGRAGTPMPAWGLLGGGPMDDQQLDDLVNYLQSIQLPKAQAIKFWQKQAQTTAINEGSVDAGGNPIITGKVLFDTNCARCHTKGYSYGEPAVSGGGGQYGPNLTGGDELRQFPAEKDQIDFVTKGVDPGKGYGTGGIATDYGGGMPHFGGYLSPQEIKEIVDYERSL